jgi:hypothetical protein
MGDKMRQTYWWLVTFRENGQLVVMGRYDSEIEATRVGITKLQGQSYQVFELDTADQARATKIIKYKILEQTGDLERALRRARHQI